jgi:hypothetical protein
MVPMVSAEPRQYFSVSHFVSAPPVQFPESMFACEYKCGYTGDFNQVSAHEASCNYCRSLPEHYSQQGVLDSMGYASHIYVSPSLQPVMQTHLDSFYSPVPHLVPDMGLSEQQEGLRFRRSVYPYNPSFEPDHMSPSVNAYAPLQLLRHQAPEESAERVGTGSKRAFQWQLQAALGLMALILSAGIYTKLFSHSSAPAPHRPSCPFGCCFKGNLYGCSSCCEDPVILMMAKQEANKEVQELKEKLAEAQLQHARNQMPSHTTHPTATDGTPFTLAEKKLEDKDTEEIHVIQRWIASCVSSISSFVACRCSIYLLSWYKSTNTDATRAQRGLAAPTPLPYVGQVCCVFRIGRKHTSRSSARLQESVPAQAYSNSRSPTASCFLTFV